MSIDIVCITENGFGRRTPSSEFRRQSRGGVGITCIPTSVVAGKVVAAVGVDDRSSIVVVTGAGKVVRIAASSLPRRGKESSVTPVVDMEEGDTVVSVDVVEIQPPMVCGNCGTVPQKSLIIGADNLAQADWMCDCGGLRFPVGKSTAQPALPAGVQELEEAGWQVFRELESGN